jgi:hypothetical protein
MLDTSFQAIVMQLVDMKAGSLLGTAILVINNSYSPWQIIYVYAPIYITIAVIYDQKLEALLHENMYSSEYDLPGLGAYIAGNTTKFAVILAAAFIWQEKELSMFYEYRRSKTMKESFERVLHLQSDCVLIQKKEEPKKAEEKVGTPQDV